MHVMMYEWYGLYLIILVSIISSATDTRYCESVTRWHTFTLEYLEYLEYLPWNPFALPRPERCLMNNLICEALPSGDNNNKYKRDEQRVRHKDKRDKVASEPTLAFLSISCQLPRFRCSPLSMQRYTTDYLTPTECQPGALQRGHVSSTYLT